MFTETYPLPKVQTSALHRSHIRLLLSRLDQKFFSCTAYDTAWLARVKDPRDRMHLLYPQALEWLRQHQHGDGSWGSDIAYYHDRIVSTLSALLALAENRRDPGDQSAIARGERYIWQHFDRLASEPNDTVGFELIVPVLFDQASLLGLDLPYAKCEPYRRIRAEKLGMIPPDLLYSRSVSSTHSLEFAGDGLSMYGIEQLQEPNGSFGNSPSATAYVLNADPSNVHARKYLDEVLSISGGAAMSAHPVDIFNASWILYNLELTGIMNDFSDLVRKPIDHLWNSWNNQYGVGFARGYPVYDLDDTAVVFKLLRRYGYPVNPDVFLQYEKETHFNCYTFERTPSIGANVHLLDTLGTILGYEPRARMVKKIIRFLRSTRRENAYWLDKWHISPYYITAHAVIALIGFDNDMARDAIQWMLDTQNPDGSWGRYEPTCEETAYCIQALVTYNNLVEPIPYSSVYQAAEYLYRSYGAWDMPDMWIEKCLYTPLQVVEATILSALTMSTHL